MPTRERRAKTIGVAVDDLPDGRGRHGHQPNGPAHPRWNSGRMLTEDGYVKVRVGREHPLADPNGYALEHLLVWVAAGRPAPGPGELLHHRDENKQNNALENLRLKARGRHGAEHNAARVFRPVLSEQIVFVMRERRAAGESLSSIAQDYGVPFQTVSKIVRGLLYAYVVGPIQPKARRVQDPKTGRLGWKR